MTKVRPRIPHDYFPPFGGLKSFYEVALTGSAVKAAERLQVSASSISHQVKSLESELGVRLVENRKGRLFLTADGAQFFDQIKGPMSEILRATEAIRSMPGRKRISLTLTPSFAAGWLLPRLSDLERSHPDLEVNLVTTTRVVDLERENVDLAIRRGMGEWPQTVVTPLMREVIVPVMSPAFVQTIRGMAMEEVLKTQRVLANTTVDAEWDYWCQARGFQPPAANQRYSLETYELTIQAAQDGLGIALGRRPLVDSLLSAGVLCAPFDLPDADNIGYYVARPDGAMRSDVKRFHDWLLTQRN
ncbi:MULTISPECIES: LysR substrate-binding domain-containing protein [unclassified Ruegeria]|uniref:LysR substrate-binding domain-containing protein n=1 Tax=unclassified Ruegeria TaxID=2625375 RepID=UPI001ADB27B4|nr:MULTISPECIES: LysR substrate-binding domain-containing protein [unclassified Ruegeria]MBO9412615.1 LysR family transcriptional regulator [Ruegeria sp. R8_1]MBO9416147.1 LysR family transcriptional regulator [Ruegeria sp. R8_2]